MIETRTVGEQLIQLCQEQLVAGQWGVGDRFPSERDLADIHGISRATANKVVAKLVSEGWLEIRRGLGTFVAARPGFSAALHELESFTDFAAQLGMGCETQVISFEPMLTGQSTIRIELELADGEHLIAFERIRRLAGSAVIYEQRWVPERMFEGLHAQVLSGSFYRLCREQYGICIERESHRVMAVQAPAVSGFAASMPALCLDGVGLAAGDLPIWKQRVYYRGDAFYLQQDSNAIGGRSRFRFQLQNDFLEQLTLNHTDPR